MTKTDGEKEAVTDWDSSGDAAEHHDPLLECLVALTRIHAVPHSADALSAGLPLVDHKLTPSLLARAAKRAGLASKVMRRSLEQIDTALMPVVLLLNEGGACLLIGWEPDGSARVVQQRRERRCWHTVVGLSCIPLIFNSFLAIQYLVMRHLLKSQLHWPAGHSRLYWNLIVEGWESGEFHIPPDYESLPETILNNLQVFQQSIGNAIPPGYLYFLIVSWSRGHGMVMLELF